MIRHDYHWKYHKGMSEKERKELNMGDIWINGLVCRKCGQFIRSKNRHDFVKCECGACGVDGGSWYLKFMGNPNDYIPVVEYFEENED